MLTYDVGVALFSKKFNRPPTQAEAARILDTVKELYVELNQSQPTCPRVSLEHLRTNAGVMEVLDVALSAQPSVTEPHSFVFDYGQFMEHLKAHRALVVPRVGCLVQTNAGNVQLVSATEYSTLGRHRLQDVFKTCLPVIVLQQ